MPNPSQLNSVLERNISAMRERKIFEDEQRTFTTKLIDAISSFAGSLPFVAVNLVIVVLWIVFNIGVLKVVAPFDPSFVGLGTTVSTEALILSAFILISQNRTAAVERRRAELDVQISLLAEHEITRLIHIVTAIASHLDVKIPEEDRVEELKGEVTPEEVLDKLEATEP